jgi:hypothetical protein
VIELEVSAETTPAARVPGTPSTLELVVTVVVPEEDDDDDTDVETDELEELEFETDETETLPGAPGVPWIAPVAVGEPWSILCSSDRTQVISARCPTRKPGMNILGPIRQETGPIAILARSIVEIFPAANSRCGPARVAPAPAAAPSA